LFFFSSRRRHTRFSRDWSSDVCSSDLAQQQNKEKYRDKANDPVAKLPYYKKLRWADGLFRAGSYFNAIEYYHQLLAEQERNPYRSEEHTSELQSRENLVCRLLLEKKKT